MKVKDQKEWDNLKAINSDGYSLVPIQMVEKWASLIEDSIEKNGIEATDFNDLSHKAAKGLGATGAQAGFARQMLRHCWVHGEEYQEQIEELNF